MPALPRSRFVTLGRAAAGLPRGPAAAQIPARRRTHPPALSPPEARRMIQFHVDPVHRMRIATFEGTVDDAQLLRSYTELTSAPDYDPTLSDLVDMSRVQRLDVSSEAVRRLVDMYSLVDPDDVVQRTAIVAAQDHVFGMARMYQILREGAPDIIRIFRDRDEAIRWVAGAE